MTIDELREIVAGSPTEGSATSALAILTGLARDGNVEATVSLLRALNREFAAGAEPAALTSVRSRAELLALEDLPALLRVYAALLQPRSIVTDLDTLSMLAKMPVPAASFAGLQRLVSIDSVLQHEALKVFILRALMEQFAMWSDLRMPAGHRLAMLDRALDDACVVPGDNADASLRFGRDLLLRLTSAESFFFIIHHEVGHSVFNAVIGGGAHAVAPATSVSPDILDALTGLADAAQRLRAAPVRPDDARRFRSVSGVSILSSLVKKSGGEYFHWSLTHQAGPIDLMAAATHAFLILSALGVDATRAAAAYSSRGMFHFGYRAEDVGTVNSPEAKPSERRSANGPDDGVSGHRWLEDLKAAGRFGSSEGDVATLLGVAPPAPTFFGTEPNTTLADIKMVAAALAFASLPQLDEKQAQAVLGASWRAAEPILLRQVLETRPNPAALVRASALPLAGIGASVCAIRDGDGVACYGPRLRDVNQVLRTLHEFGADLEGAADRSGRTLLTVAVTKGAEPVRVLLDCGVDVNRADAGGETPLLVCAAVGTLEVATALIDAGASVAARDPDGNTALHRAAANGHADVLRLLLERGGNANAASALGETPLMAAENADSVDALCARGASVEASTPDGTTALLKAAAAGHAAVVRALLAHGADPHAANQLGETPLHYAAFRPAQQGGAACMEALLDAGADVNEETNEGVTPLMGAARHGEVASVELLLARGADADARTRTGVTALIMASDGRNEWTRDFSFGSRLQSCLRTLVDAGADVNAASGAGITPLLAAMWGFDAGRVELLLELGADANLASRDGVTPLALAADQGHGAMTEALLAAGARIDTTDAEGNTPLLRALKAGQKGDDAVEPLLRAGALVTHRNARGESALDLVSDSSVSDAVRVLVRGAQQKQTPNGGTR